MHLVLGPAEREALNSPQRPIVLLRKKKDIAAIAPDAEARAGDDAAEVRWHDPRTPPEGGMAFDHAMIMRDIADELLRRTA
jgi:hypothetical protein